jgi:hypothetical protein
VAGRWILPHSRASDASRFFEAGAKALAAQLAEMFFPELVLGVAKAERH